MKIAFMPGDGIGPEISAATRLVLDAANRHFGLGFRYSEIEIGFDALRKHGSTLPDASFDRAREADALILGPVSHLDYPPREMGGLNPSGELRKRLDLYANIRPAATRKGLKSATGAEFDMVIYRENTEGFYADRCMHTGLVRKIFVEAGRAAS
jgi:3-isopropylmalate dehydrogenase